MPHQAAAHAFSRLVEIMAVLRSPEGCPWDREQTIDSLKPYVLEETYEMLEAIDRHDHHGLCEELGDFMFEAVFLAQLEGEAGHFTIADALTTVADKLVRRHPHVFDRKPGDASIDSGEVITRWEEIKKRERAHDARARTLLSGIPRALPALLRADQLGRRAASVGFDWSRPEEVMDKIREEIQELDEVVQAGSDRARLEDEMGDLLLAIASLSRKLGIEPESALRKANDKFTRRFEAMEQRIQETGRVMREMPLQDLEAEWQSVKARE